MRRLDVFNQPIGSSPRRAPAGADQKLAAGRLRKRARLACQLLTGRPGEAAGAAVAADQNGDPRFRQMGDFRAPFICRNRQGFVARLIEWQGVHQDVGPFGQAVLRRGDHQIEQIEIRPGSADADDPASSFGHRLDARRIDHAPAAGDQDQVRPEQAGEQRVVPVKAHAGSMRRRSTMVIGTESTSPRTSNGQPNAWARIRSCALSPWVVPQRTDTLGKVEDGDCGAAVLGQACVWLRMTPADFREYIETRRSSRRKEADW